MATRPYVTIIAGPNGAGKSTIANSLDLPGEAVNADAIARTLDDERPERASLAAGRLVIRRLKSLIRQRLDFSYETTLSSRHSISTLRNARLAGYEIGLVFVFVRTADLCVRRVEDRVNAGGHDIPADTVRRRFDITFDNLEVAMTIADAVVVYDNSDNIEPREVLRMADGRLVHSSLDLALEAHARLKRACEERRVST